MSECNEWTVPHLPMCCMKGEITWLLQHLGWRTKFIGHNSVINKAIYNNIKTVSELFHYKWNRTNTWIEWRQRLGRFDALISPGILPRITTSLDLVSRYPFHKSSFPFGFKWPENNIFLGISSTSPLRFNTTLRHPFNSWIPYGNITCMVNEVNFFFGGGDCGKTRQYQK